jgi:putative endonuclease
MSGLYYVYILTSTRRGTLYIGITSDLAKRVREHKSGSVEGFTKHYKVDRLVYYDVFTNPLEAISSEKQLKSWHRDWKINLIEAKNPEWRDLAGELKDQASRGS